METTSPDYPIINQMLEAGEVTIRGRLQDHDKLCFEIIDNGIGLPNEDQDHLFHPFLQPNRPAQVPDSAYISAG